MISRFLLAILASASLLPAQSISGGTILGTLKDPSGAGLPGATVTAINLVTSFKTGTKSGADGSYRLPNLPPNVYHLEIKKEGFTSLSRDVTVRGQVPQTLDFALALATQQTDLEVHGFGDDVLENVAFAHTDADSATLSRLPIHSPGAGLSDAITFSAPGVVADSDGFFHPLGDHAQVGFSIDGQPVTDQQSKRFSTQLPVNAVQSMELITGSPNAEYGDKTSLVVNTVTKSGLGVDRPTGQVLFGYGSFGSPTLESSVAVGGKTWGNFLAANAERSGRFLDTPEFRPTHAIGNTQTFFDRVDLQPTSKDSLHLNLMYARNWFQIPTSLDAPDSDQRQLTRTVNVAPSYQRVISASTLLSANAFFRRDAIDFYPSRNPAFDLPVSASQSRTLANSGFRTDVAHVKGRFDVKTGIQYTHTNIHEQFQIALAKPFAFNKRAGINQFAWYAQCSITLGNLVVNTGLRIDYYDGLVTKTGVQPRAGLSYKIKSTGTVLRASYSRSLETPYNENLLLSGATTPGGRNQYNAGFQQTLGKYLILDGDYFWKFTRNAYDFAVLGNTPITFPIVWRKSNIDGLSVRLSTREWRGLQAFTTIGSTRARFFPGSTGGVSFQDPPEADGVFRIDHDQKFQHTSHLRYQHQRGPWMAFTWRYDSGLVTGAVSGCDDALDLSDNDKHSIGFTGTAAKCSSALIDIPQPGTENADHNPGRMRPRNLFNIGVGHDNLFHHDRRHLSLRLNVVNLTDLVALYNFKSTFGGTHYVTPRAISATVGYSF